MDYTPIADRITEARTELSAWTAEIPETRIYSEEHYPPGGIKVDEATIEGKSFYDVNTKRGIPPLAEIVAGGRVQEDEMFDEWYTPRFPFRFPWHSRAYGVWIERDVLSAIVRNVAPMELVFGMHAVVSYNEKKDWAAIIGRVASVKTNHFIFAKPSGEEETVMMEDVQFVGKVVGFWKTGSAA